MAALPCGERTTRASRSRYGSVDRRKIPVPEHPTTLGGYLRRRRAELDLTQLQVARKLAVTPETMSSWERDKSRPRWVYLPRLIDHLGFDPFKNPAFGSAGSNESSLVASLSPETGQSVGEMLRKKRLLLRKTQKEFATLLGK